LVFAELSGRFNGQEFIKKSFATIKSGELHTQSQDFIELNPIHPQILSLAKNDAAKAT
jgi:hypothetical protein